MARHRLPACRQAGSGITDHDGTAVGRLGGRPGRRRGGRVLRLATAGLRVRDQRISGFVVRLRGRLDALPMVPGGWPTCSEVVGVTITEHLDRFQRKHPWAGFPLAVAYKYFDDFGTYLAALITYYGFVSLFPLLLLLSTILGFVLSGDQRLQQEVLDSALHQVPVIGQDLGRPGRIGGGPVGLVVGVLGSLYGGLGVAQAFQFAMNSMWAVPRDQRPNPFKARGRSLVLLFVG